MVQEHSSPFGSGKPANRDCWPPPGVVDTSTLAAHDFDVDNRTGFMPPQPPVARLSSEWEVWEDLLDDGTGGKLVLGDRATEEELKKGEEWRRRVENMPILPTEALKASEPVLRRAHHVLAWLLHIYIHTHAPCSSNSSIHVPPPLTVPLLRVSQHLALPPVLTYSDDVLYNWRFSSETQAETLPTTENITTQTLFTPTLTESHFYLVSARIELVGVRALDLMRSMMDELFVSDAIAVRRITSSLIRLADVIEELTTVLMSVRDGCDPQIFYHDVRPWFKGQDSGGREWIFDGIELDPTLSAPTELSGPSAGQSSLIHALDIFLGLDTHSPSPSTSTSGGESFLKRMQRYMPRHHRAFLSHLSTSPYPLRGLVVSENATADLKEAYNKAVGSLKNFRDAHMKVVVLYIVGPARRRPAGESKEKKEEEGGLKGTGGTELVRFLKGVRERTGEGVVDGLNA
ncbi:Indoleamine 2,3-dioxygenase [Cyathus striatus]|nr:Indoleamine 2,3-dioxygenase [Cyathus striatus]